MKATIKQGEPIYPPPTYVLELNEDEAHVVLALVNGAIGESVPKYIANGIRIGLEELIPEGKPRYRTQTFTRLEVLSED